MARGNKTSKRDRTTDSDLLPEDTSEQTTLLEKLRSSKTDMPVDGPRYEIDSRYDYPRTPNFDSRSTTVPDDTSSREDMSTDRIGKLSEIVSTAAEGARPKSSEASPTVNSKSTANRDAVDVGDVLDTTEFLRGFRDPGMPKFREATAYRVDDTGKLVPYIKTGRPIGEEVVTRHTSKWEPLPPEPTKQEPVVPILKSSSETRATNAGEAAISGTNVAKTLVGAADQKARQNPSGTPAPSDIAKAQRGLDGLLGEMSKLNFASTQADPESTRKYEEQRASLAQQIKEARDRYDQRVSNAEWGEVMQRIANGVIQMGAAQIGLNTGVDMSKIDLGKSDVDYEKKAER